MGDGASQFQSWAIRGGASERFAAVTLFGASKVWSTKVVLHWAVANCGA